MDYITGKKCEYNFELSQSSNNPVASEKTYFENQDILKTISALNINKAHVHDNISRSTIKICYSIIVKPLPIIFRNRLNSGIIADNGKMSIIIPVLHRLGSKQLI